MHSIIAKVQVSDILSFGSLSDLDLKFWNFFREVFHIWNFLVFLLLVSYGFLPIFDRQSPRDCIDLRKLLGSLVVSVQVRYLLLADVCLLDFTDNVQSFFVWCRLVFLLLLVFALIREH